MNLQQQLHSPSAQLYYGAPEEPPSSIDQVVLHHLRDRRAIEAYLHLRGEIDLSAHAGAGFAALEKKETKSAWCSVSSWTGRPSARSASFPWGMTSP
jgi:hypothetical protein